MAMTIVEEEVGDDGWIHSLGFRVKRLPDITISGVFQSDAYWTERIKKGDTFWVEIPESKPPARVRVFVVQVRMKNGVPTKVVLRPTGKPERIRKPKKRGGSR